LIDEIAGDTGWQFANLTFTFYLVENMMISHPKEIAPDPVRERLLKAALDNFLSDEYHKVTTRLIAEKADANISMIRYYFGNKEGLYEEMIRETLNPLLNVLDGQMLTSIDGFKDFLWLYYETISKRPEFPKLILKVLALNQGPGRRFIQQLLERGRTRSAKKVEDLKSAGQVTLLLDPDIVRMAFVSLAMMPMLLKDIFEEQMGRPMDAVFLEKLAEFNGRLFSAGLAPTKSE
jgi:AcrR family transcriptional regulator